MSRTSSSSSRTYDKKKYQTIFPQYLDASLQPHEGRRLTRTQAVVCPTLEEMVIAARQLGFTECFVDPTKSLPRNQSQLKQVPAPRGCLKIAIKQPADVHYIKKSEFDVATRAAVVEGFGSKQQVLRRIAEVIKAKGGARPTPVNMTPAHQQKESNATGGGGRGGSAPGGGGAPPAKRR